MHRQVEQDTEEGSATVIIQVQWSVLLTVGAQGRREDKWATDASFMHMGPEAPKLDL
jgi:hypothetical protein